jgi:hypothetical protein
VGSGTVRGEITRVVKKVDQKIEDFKGACGMSVAYMPEAIARRVGQVGMGLLKGLLDFAKDAVKILAVSTAIGALIGALFGGVGAIPGAEIGFEIGLLLLKMYGLAQLIEAVLGIAGGLVGQLGKFIEIVWSANGDRKQLDLGARALADAIGILVSAVLIAIAAFLLKKGGEALGKTKFAQTVGETRLAQWFKARQQLETSRGNEKVSAKLDGAKAGTPFLKGADRAIIDPRKLTEYALNPSHPVGGSKARVFKSALGFTKENAEALIAQLREGVKNNPAIPGKVDQFGSRFTVDILVTGPAGSGVVRSGWIYKTGSNVPELTTVFVK